MSKHQSTRISKPRNLTIKQLAEACLAHGVEVKIELVPMTRKLPFKATVSDPSAGVYSFMIFNSKLSIYTSIGADNIHHASNKATKLFGNCWTSLKVNTHNNVFEAGRMGYTCYSVAEFSELIRSL